MKKSQVVIILTLAALLLLSGCNKKDKNDTTLQPEIDPIESTQNTEDKTEAETSEEPVTDVPPADGMVRSRITNEWIDEKTANRRPISIMIPNTKTASQYGISTADVICIGLLNGILFTSTTAVPFIWMV